MLRIIYSYTITQGLLPWGSIRKAMPMWKMTLLYEHLYTSAGWLVRDRMCKTHSAIGTKRTIYTGQLHMAIADFFSAVPVELWYWVLDIDLACPNRPLQSTCSNHGLQCTMTMIFNFFNSASGHLTPTPAWILTSHLLLICACSACQLWTWPVQAWTRPELLHLSCLPVCSSTYYASALSLVCWSCIRPSGRLLQWPFSCLSSFRRCSHITDLISGSHLPVPADQRGNHATPCPYATNPWLLRRNGPRYKWM